MTTLHHAPLPSGVNVFYRQFGTGAKTLLLLHGFPSSSHQYRDLIPLITHYRVIAPDLPGFGFTTAPADFKYTFDSLANVMCEFVDALSIPRFAVYIFDYGAPTALRLALKRPTAIEAIISQNGNAYVEGLGDAWAPVREFWASKNTAADRSKLASGLLTFDTTKFQYVNGTPDPSKIAPESYHLDWALMQRPGQEDIQLDLFLDYQNNIALYPKFHEYFKSSQVPLLAVWGSNDVFFTPPGAEAFKRDLPKAVVKVIDAGHFAIESDTALIAKEINSFLKSL